MFVLSDRVRVIRSGPHACRIVRAAMLSGLILYYGVIPFEFLVTGEYRVQNEFLNTELAARSMIDGLAVVILVFFGFWFTTRPLALMNHNVVRVSEVGVCASGVATVLVIAFFALAMRTGIFLKATSVELAATLDNTYGVAFNSLVLTAASAACAVAVAWYAFDAATRRKSALLLLAVVALGGLGIQFGDKDPLGAAVFMFIASLSMRLRGRFLPLMVACALCVGGLFALSAVSMVKFMFFGIEPDLSLLLLRPSSSDPGGAFALMATAMDGSAPLGMADYNPLVSMWGDVGSAVPHWIWANRPQSPGALLASSLMGSAYVEGYGVGYSPYLDIYSGLGPIGLVIAGMIIGWAVTRLLRIAARIDSTGRLVLLCASMNFYVIVACQRLSLMGSLKQLLYFNAAAISAFLIVLGFGRVRRFMVGGGLRLQPCANDRSV